MQSDLEDALRQLHVALESIDNLDAEEVARLKQAASEIEATLDSQDVDSASLAKMLQQQTDAFQQSHPVLTRTVGRVADMLAQMGI